jgi:hypothetical protein
MTEITIDLREGFFQDVVGGGWAGAARVRASGVTTRMQTAFAGSLPLDKTAGVTSLSIEVPTRGLAAEAALPPERPLWVGVSILEPNRLEVRVQAEPFGYL